MSKAQIGSNMVSDELGWNQTKWVVLNALFIFKKRNDVCSAEGILREIGGGRSIQCLRTLLRRYQRMGLVKCFQRRGGNKTTGQLYWGITTKGEQRLRWLSRED